MSSPPLLQGPLITQPNFTAPHCLGIGKTEEIPQPRQTRYTSHQCISGEFLPLTGIRASEGGYGRYCKGLKSLAY